MADALMSCAGAFVAVPSSSGIDHEGFLYSKINGTHEYHWIRIQGVDPRSGSPAHAQLEVSPSLERLLGGSGALGKVSSRLRSSPNVDHFLRDLQEVLERLAYSTIAGPHVRNRGVCSSSSSFRVMQLLLRDLDELGWGCLEELDQDAARMTLILVDEHCREHRLRLNLPYDYPASQPAAATDLPTPFTFTWHPPPLPPLPDCGRHVSGNGAGSSGTVSAGHRWDRSNWMNAGQYQQQPKHQQQHYHHHHHHHRQHLSGKGDGHVSSTGGGGGGGGGGSSSGSACSSLADVFRAFQTAVAQHQTLWRCLDDLDRRTRVLDPPPSLSATKRHLGPPYRRLALGGAASLQLRLDLADPRGPPPPGGVVFLGPPDCVAHLREGFFGRLHLWNRDSDPVDNLELLLGQPLPAPQGGRRLCGGLGTINTTGDYMEMVDVQGDGKWQEEEVEPLMSECPICMMYLLPVGDNGDDSDGAAAYGDVSAMDGLDDDGRERGGAAQALRFRRAADANNDAGTARGNGVAPAGDGFCAGLVPDVVCPTPACGLAFHTRCLAEWLRSLPDTRVSFNKLFGRCPFCSNPITVRA
ncbi:hypothetical protein Vretimale_10914 [Volvox reticuliferus]|uniref:RING-type domain-containing protein n=1 Tax=Volvox reticuliferus TaxID=1737510 RepID=A0A8J4CJY8_9CHLO|nr:hypothetical protein Vretifemale_12658 [Volvox reticuliferus]GIM06652.1 hypothetical protein Vretimale_10914 [Volvox reticuliferus]